MESMQKAIAELIEKKTAYVGSDGSIYFDATSFESYGAISGNRLEALKPGHRHEYKDESGKRFHADWALWKLAGARTQMIWESPWGAGFPGWHIECSAMSETHLGETFDIHAGGLDLIFPHHENEIAQSRSAFGHAIMAKYWMHNGFLNISGEKMSKSLGNFFTVHELLDQYPGEVIRLLLLSAQYRQPLDFTPEGLAQAKGTLDRWYGLLRGKALEATPIPAPVEQALSDDLNTPLAISALHQLRDPSELKAGASALGLLQQDPEDWFRWTPASAVAGPSDAEIEAAIVARQAARKAKDFKESDRIRDDLKAKGVILEDGPKGTSWKRG